MAKEIPKDCIIYHLITLYEFEPSVKISLLPKGTESAVWLVEDKKDKWLTKVFGLHEGPRERLEDEVSLYDYLNSHAIHAPTIRQSIHHENVSFIDFKGYQFFTILMRYEKLTRCTPSQITHDELIRIAKETAHMHKVLHDFPRNVAKQESAREWLGSRNPKSAIEALSQSIHLKAFSLEQQKKFAGIDAQMEKYSKTCQSILPLTEALIHGDLALEHTPLLPDGSVYFFDFSDRLWGPVAQELAVFITQLYQNEDVSFKRWEELRDWLLQGYQSITPLTNNDIHTIPQKAIVRILGAIKYLAVVAKDVPSEHVDDWIRRGYELGEYLLYTLRVI